MPKTHPCDNSTPVCPGVSQASFARTSSLARKAPRLGLGGPQVSAAENHKSKRSHNSSRPCTFRNRMMDSFGVRSDSKLWRHALGPFEALLSPSLHFQCL
eukprot:2580799-Amphidinium_carterae.1